MGPGKKFEQDLFRKAEKVYDVHRIRDTVGYAKTTTVADFSIYNGHSKYYIEAKSTKGKSLPFSNITMEQRDKQEAKANLGIDNLYIGFIVNFRGRHYHKEDQKFEKKSIKAGNSTYYLDHKKLWGFIDKADRKSIPIMWFQNNAREVPSNCRQTRYDYDLSILFDN